MHVSCSYVSVFNPCSAIIILCFMIYLTLQNLVASTKRPPSTRISHVDERFESAAFKSNFAEWPLAPVIGDGGSKLKGESYNFILKYLVASVVVDGGAKLPVDKY